MKKVVSGMLLDIANERSGYSIGEPWRFTELSLTAVVPLTRIDAGKRLYRLLSERKDTVKITDTGNIEKLSITNTGTFPVLIKAGEVLVGSTQSRTVTISQVIMPGEKIPVDCACVYSSKGIIAGQKMDPNYYSPTTVRRSVYKGHYYGKTLSNSDYHRDQGAIWEAINLSSHNLASSTSGFSAFMSRTSAGDFDDIPSVVDAISEILPANGGDWNPTYHTPEQDLAGRVEEAQKKYGEVIKKVPKVDHQVGLALLTMTGLESMEAFEHPDSWEGFRRAFLGAETPKIADISDRNGLFDFKAEKAKEIIVKMLTQDFEEKVVVDRPSTQTTILDAGQFTGEVVTYDGSPIHCSFLRKEI